MAIRLFDALKLEEQYLRMVVQEATSSLSIAYKVLYPLYFLSVVYRAIRLPAFVLMVVCFESQDAPSKVLKDVELLLLQNSQVVCPLINESKCTEMIIINITLIHPFPTRNKAKFAFVL